MADERADQYARLLVERSVAVEPGWQVMAFGTPLGRPLIEERCRAIARRGAQAVPVTAAQPADELARICHRGVTLTRTFPRYARSGF